MSRVRRVSSVRVATELFLQATSYMLQGTYDLRFTFRDLVQQNHGNLTPEGLGHGEGSAIDCFYCFGLQAEVLADYRTRSS